MTASSSRRGLLAEVALAGFQTFGPAKLSYVLCLLGADWGLAVASCAAGPVSQLGQDHDGILKHSWVLVGRRKQEATASVQGSQNKQVNRGAPSG